MNTYPSQSDVIIVGGRLAGLTAACYLSRGGLSVTLFEKANALGGRANTQEHDGFRFNRGIHALYCGGAAERGFKELGIKYSGHSPKRTFVLRHGQFYITPSDPLSLLRTNLLTLADKLELIRLFTILPRLNAHDFQRISIQTWLAQTIKRPQVHQLMNAFARTFVYSTALDLVSAEIFVEKMQISMKNPILYIDGGWQTLVDGLREAAALAGAQIISGERVETVLHEHGRTSGVRLKDGKMLLASTVVIAMSPKDAVKLVDEDAAPEFHRQIHELMPAQMACLDVALSRLPNGSYPVVQDLDKSIFMSTQSIYSKIAPDGGALIHTFKQLDPRQQTNPQDDERDLETLLDTVEPGWREVVVKRFFLPRIDAVGMLPTAQAGSYAGRPQPQVAGIANLYVVGDWVGSEGFLTDASLASARQVSQMIVRQGITEKRAG